MTGHELLWGDSLQSVAETIVLGAVEKGTAEAFHDAGEQLRGIESFIIFMRLGRGWDTDAVLSLGSEIVRMRTLASNTDLRECVLLAYREAVQQMRSSHV